MVLLVADCDVQLVGLIKMLIVPEPQYITADGTTADGTTTAVSLCVCLYVCVMGVYMGVCVYKYVCVQDCKYAYISLMTFTIQGHHYNKLNGEVILSAELLQALHAQAHRSTDGTDHWGHHHKRYQPRPHCVCVSVCLLFSRYTQ